MNPLGLTDHQLRTVLTHGRDVPPEFRDHYLGAIGDELIGVLLTGADPPMPMLSALFAMSSPASSERCRDPHRQARS
jgi:hypothetical protein